MERRLSRLLFLFIYASPALLNAQECSYPLGLATTKDYCLGSSLFLSSAHALKKIVWYHDGRPVDSVIATQSLDTIGTAAALNIFMESICIDDQGTLYAFDAGNYAIKAFKPGNTGGEIVAGGHGQGSQSNQTFGTETIFVDGQGEIYEADMNNLRVQKWQPGAPSGTTLFNCNEGYFLFAPNATLFDCEGNTFMSSLKDSTLQEFSAGTTSPITLTPLPPLYSGIDALELQLRKDQAGNILLLDGAPNTVWRWTPGNRSWKVLAGAYDPIPGTDQPDLVDDFWADGDDTVYLLSALTNRLVKYAPGATTGTTLIRGSTGGFSYPLCVARDNKGDFFIGSQEEHTVLKFKMTSTIDTTFTPTETGQYYAVVKDMLGYSKTTDTVYFNISQTGSPSVNITATTTSAPVCTPITFTAQIANAGPDPGLQWEVSGVKVGADSPTYSNNLFADSDRVYCILSAPAGCTGNLITDTSNILTLHIDPQGSATVAINASDTAICEGSPVVFLATVTNGSIQPTFQWLLNGLPIPGDDTAAYHTDSLANGNVITCLITSDNACGLAKSNSIPILVSAPPSIAPNQTLSIRYGQSVTLDPIVTGNILSWLWTPGASLSDSTIPDPVAAPTTTTDYKLKVVSAGCGADSGYILVDVYTPLNIPNAFTPNGDGHNDILYVLGGPLGSRIEDFSVFNRWGASVFHAHDATPGDPSAGWNGYLHGQPAPPDTYVYQVVMRFSDGSRQIYKGTVILIR
jgi:gliding motility-associated-like protein